MKHDNPLSVARINGYLTSLGAVFRYAERHGYMEKNFAEGLKLKQRKRANKQQNIFGLDDLKTVFSSPITSRTHTLSPTDSGFLF